MKSPFMALWGIPILLAILTALGLASALVGDGVWDDLSALALGAPVAVGAWCALRPSRKLLVTKRNN
jgi:hypothetical protein